MSAPSSAELLICGVVAAFITAGSVAVALAGGPLWLSWTLLAASVVGLCWALSFPVRKRRAARSGDAS